MFDSCKSLTYINIPPKVEVLKDNTFYYCTALASVTFSEGLKNLGGAFPGCTSLKEVVLPKSLEKITGADSTDAVH